jgi:hypothetical protein
MLVSVHHHYGPPNTVWGLGEEDGGAKGLSVVRQSV